MKKPLPKEARRRSNPLDQDYIRQRTQLQSAQASPRKVLSMPTPKVASPPVSPSPKKSRPADPDDSESGKKFDLSLFGEFDLDVAEDYRPLLQSLYDERRAAKIAEDAAIAYRESLDEQITSTLADIGFTRIFMPDGRKIVLANGRSASLLDAKLLVESGVDPDLIKDCTRPGTAYTYIQTPEQSAKDVATIGMLHNARAKRARDPKFQEGA